MLIIYKLMAFFFFKFISVRKYTYHEFEALANKAFLSRFCSSGSFSSSYVEKEFWREMAHGEKGTVEYAVNIEGSAFSCHPDDKLAKSKWNLKVGFRFFADSISCVLFCFLHVCSCYILVSSNINCYVQYYNSSLHVFII